MQFARERRKVSEYNLEVFRAFFQRSEDIGQIAVLASIATKVGLPQSEFTVALETGIYTAKHQELIQQGREVVNVVPTFFIAGHRLEGLQSAGKLATIIDEEIQQTQAD
jgi:predicted DsbA family dithiol-disulfide isomerase